MHTIKAQLAKIDRTRFLQLTLLAVGISTFLFSLLGILTVGWSFGFWMLIFSTVFGIGGIFVLAVALGYNPNRREN